MIPKIQFTRIWILKRCFIIGFLLHSLNRLSNYSSFSWLHSFTGSVGVLKKVKKSRHMLMIRCKTTKTWCPFFLGWIWMLTPTQEQWVIFISQHHSHTMIILGWCNNKPNWQIDRLPHWIMNTKILWVESNYNFK